MLIGQHRQVFHLLPGITEALGTFKELKQQPATLAVFQAVSQQQRRGQALGGEQSHTVQLALEMSRRLAAHQQLGQHRSAAPYTRTDITLSGQNPQQGQQL
ncbi:hypothetical protein D3C80_1587280 [compost metagenome]